MPRLQQRGGTRPTTEDCRQCRLHRHAFDDEHTEYIVDMDRPVWNRVMVLTCPRCFSVRTDKLDALYEVADRDYDYSREYREYLDGKEAPTAADLRRIMFLAHHERRETARYN